MLASSSSAQSIAAKRGHLADMGGQMNMFCAKTLDRAHMVFGNDHPADAPSGHRVILGERVDDIGVIRDLKRADCRPLVLDPVVNLVGDEDSTLAPRSAR